MENFVPNINFDPIFKFALFGIVCAIFGVIGFVIWLCEFIFKMGVKSARNKEKYVNIDL